MNVIIFLIVLAVLILVHEFGHFVTAKKAGVRVDEFGLGFPPKLWGVKSGETEYTVNAIPFGGFVKIFGENPDEDSLAGPDSARSFINKPKWIQAAIIGAGVFFNFLLAWVLFSAGFLVGMPVPLEEVPLNAFVKEERLVIVGIATNSPAEKAGLSSGDAILSLSSSVETLTPRTITSVQEFIGRHDGVEISLTYRSGGEEKTVSLVPEEGIVDNAPAIGIAMELVATVTLPVHRAIWEGGKTTVVMTAATAAAFGSLLADAFRGSADLSGLAGPVGIVSLVGDAANLGFIPLLTFVAFISINLAILNLVPFPALDGGRLLFLLIEAVKGSPLNYKIVNFMHAVGFAVLIILLLLVTYNDILRIVK